MSVPDLEGFFHTQLVKYGVSYDLAAKAAEILASGKPDELLTAQEKDWAREACQQWSQQRQALERINSVLSK